MARRIARPIHVVVAWLFVIGLLVQVFLAGMGVFDRPSAFVTHRDTGYALTVLPVVLLVTALVGRFGRWQAIAAAVMFVQFILQSVLVLQRDSVPAIAALHPVNGSSSCSSRSGWPATRGACSRPIASPPPQGRARPSLPRADGRPAPSVSEWPPDDRSNRDARRPRWRRA